MALLSKYKGNIKYQGNKQTNFLHKNHKSQEKCSKGVFGA